MRRPSYLLGFSLLALVCVALPVRAEKGAFVGLDIGEAEPLNDNFRVFADSGAVIKPYAGYMLNDTFGLQSDLFVTWNGASGDVDTQTNQDISMFGASAGPRIDIPLGGLIEGLNAYATVQGGIITGLSGAVNDTGALFSTGGGLDYSLNRNLSVGIWGRWNRGYISPKPYSLPNHVSDDQGPEDVRMSFAGLGVKYAFVAEPPLPPPPPPAPAAAPPPPVKKKIVLRAVHFDFDKANIRPDAVPILDEAVSTLKAESGIAVSVEGHTDSKGTDAYNMKLSDRRASAVKEYLVKHGIASSRLTAVGFGESKPVATNETAAGRAENRRVELKVQ